MVKKSSRFILEVQYESLKMKTGEEYSNVADLVLDGPTLYVLALCVVILSLLVEKTMYNSLK